MPDYGKAGYWDERYALDPKAHFDWLQTWDGLRQAVQPFLSRDAEILHVGTGNSRLPEELFNDGYRLQTAIDVSPVVVRQMQERYGALEEVEFAVMDATKLFYPSATFDVVLDKATLDSVLCGENAFANAVTMVNEIYRVLKPGGSYIVVTYGQPASRLPYLETRALNWSVSHTAVAKPDLDEDGNVRTDGRGGASAAQGSAAGVHYIFTCTKSLHA